MRGDGVCLPVAFSQRLYPLPSSLTTWPKVPIVPDQLRGDMSPDERRRALANATRVKAYLESHFKNTPVVFDLEPQPGTHHEGDVAIFVVATDRKLTLVVPRLLLTITGLIDWFLVGGAMAAALSMTPPGNALILQAGGRSSHIPWA
jgi:hypothetical protein